MNKFDRLVEQTLGYFLAVNGSLLAIVSVVVHRDNMAHLAFITPLGIVVALFGVWFANSDYSNKVYYHNTPSKDKGNK